MSGIFGILDSKHQTQVNQQLAQMGRSMSHCPWHVVETHADETAGVGLGRIGIGIFNAEPQPATSEDGKLLVCLAGEFYDTGPLRQSLQVKGYALRDSSDAELLLRLYQANGTQFIHSLEGAFICAIWDKTCQELIMANDRFGLYPLVYAHYNGKFVFAPEMKAILGQPDFNKELDMTALAEYVRFQQLLGDKTFFTGIKLLTNAVTLCYQTLTDQVTIRPYWDMAQLKPATLKPTFEEAAEEAGRLLQIAVHKRTEGNHRFGVYLSGGLDSRAILGFACKDKPSVTSITYGRRQCRDAVYGQQIAKIARTRHHYFEFQDGRWVQEMAGLHLDLTEGFHSWIHSHGMSILAQARPLMDVNLTGFGGGDSSWEDLPLLKAPDDQAFRARLYYLLCQETTWPSISDAEEQCLYTPRMASQMWRLAFESFSTELAKFEHLDNEKRASAFGTYNTERRMFQYYTVFNRSHFEQRFPFFDYRYTEFIGNLPAEMLFERRLRRKIIHSRLRPLARVPYDKDDLPVTDGEASRVMSRLARRGKSLVNQQLGPVFPQYFTLYADYENWLRHELREWGQDLLLGERALNRGIFAPDMMQSLWNRHQSGLEMHTIGKLAPLMTYEMLLRRFCD